jgi:dethiobiotin synthetase
MKLFITAIGTDCGKTLVSSIFCEALKAAYWKPVQTGVPPKDSDTVRDLVSFQISVFPETYLLSEPASPHYAASLEGIEIKLTDFSLPETQSDLVIEGAGGLLVPLNNKGEFLLDFALLHSLETVLVIRLYLGCINQALLSINELNRRGAKIKGLVFNGKDTFGAVEIIESISKLPVLLHVENEKEINRETVTRYSKLLKI